MNLIDKIVTRILRGKYYKCPECGVFVCETKDGKRFNCNAKCNDDIKRNILRFKSTWIGRMLKVRYQELSDNGIPTFLSGII